MGPTSGQDRTIQYVGNGAGSALVGTILGGIERSDSPDATQQQLGRALALLEDGLRSLE